MIRILLVLGLSLLLSGMQQQRLVHEVSHLRAQVERGSDVVLQSDAGGECLECALLASGANAAPNADATIALTVAASSRAVPAFIAPALPQRTAYYRSRAPPAFL